MAEAVTLKLHRVEFPHARLDIGDVPDDVSVALTTKLTIQRLWNTKNNKLFKVVMDVNCNSNGDRTLVALTCHGVFESSVAVDDVFKKGQYPRINAPAILFPFVRAFVASLTQSAGFTPLYLESFNFVENAKDGDFKEDDTYTST